MADNNDDVALGSRAARGLVVLVVPILAMAGASMDLAPILRKPLLKIGMSLNYLNQMLMGDWETSQDKWTILSGGLAITLAWALAGLAIPLLLF